jgi:hypothetical protein
MAQDPETTRAKVQKRTKRISAPPPYKPPTATGKDVKSDADRSRATAYKKTPKYHHQVLQTYKEQPTKQRSAIARNAIGEPRKSIQHYHQSAIARNRELAQSAAQKDTKGNVDYFRGRRAAKYERAHTELVNLAREIISAHAKAPAPGVTGDTKGDFERLTAEAYKVTPEFSHDLAAGAKAGIEYQAQKAKKAENAKYSGSPGRLISGFIHMKGPVAETVHGASDIAGKLAKFSGAAAAPNIAATLAGIDKLTGSHTVDTAGKVVENAGKELVDLPANAVPSLYYAGQPLVAGALSGDSKKLGKGGSETLHRLTQPYVNLAEHPGKSFTEHPLSSALMVVGGAKALDRVAGRVEQQAVPGFKPRKPYAPIERKLPGTAAKDVFLPRQGAVAYRLQKKMGGYSTVKRIQKGNPTRMTDADIARRTDELYYHSIHTSRQEAYDAIRKAADKGLSEEAQQKIGKDTLKATRKRLRDETAMDMALRDKAGRLRTHHFVDGKGGAAQTIERWGQSLINQGRQAAMETYTYGKKNKKQVRGARGKDVQTLVPYKVKTGQFKNKYIVIPKIAADQLAQHDSYLQETPLSTLGQAVGGTFRRTVLPFSPKWLNNNYTEAALRGAINGAGPMSFREARKVFGELSVPNAAEWNSLVKSAGHGGMQRQLLQEGTTYAERLEHTKYENLGRALTKFGQKSGPKTIAHVFDKYTDIVFSQLNGRMENAMHMGMAGKVLRRNPLMSKRIVELTSKAMKNPDGPASVEARNNLIALGREVDRMFGKYGKFSPAMRRSIATWTPFIPWTLNALHFITQHLPNDHPVVTSLIASAHQAATEWRNQHGLGYFVDGAVPPFLQGAIPGSNGSHWMIFSQGTPFGAFGDPTGTAARGFNPLGQTILYNLNGKDWKGDDFKHPNPLYNTEQAIVSLLEATTPIGYATSKIEGSGNDKSAKENLQNWANPYHPVKGKEPKGSKKAKKPGELFPSRQKSQPSVWGSGSSSSGPSVFGP